MGLKTTNKQVIKEVPYGVYVWQTPDGEFLGDDNDNFMMVFCEEGNQDAIKALTDAARFYGYPEGRAVYWSGKRPIDDEEYQRQLARAAAGLVPDPFDIGAIRDEARGLENERKTR